MQELKIKVPGEYTLESEWTAAWGKALKAKGFWRYKITDASQGKKPLDIIVSTNLGFYSIEVKGVDSDIFYVKKIRDHQWTALKDISELGQNALIVVYSIKYNDYKIINFKKILPCGVNDRIKLNF